METYYTVPTFEKSPNQMLAEEILDAAWDLEDPKKPIKTAKKAWAITPL